MVDGYTKRRERQMNDQIQVGHIIAGKISQAVWGDKGFKKPIKEINLTQKDNTTEERNNKVLKTLKAKGLI